MKIIRVRQKIWEIQRNSFKIVKDSNKSSLSRKPVSRRSLRDFPEAAGLLPLLKDLNLLHASAEKKGFEFLSYLLQMAILEAQSLASGGGGLDASSRNRGGSSHNGR